jgi:hypothetical protein
VALQEYDSGKEYPGALRKSILLYQVGLPYQAINAKARRISLDITLLRT